MGWTLLSIGNDDNDFVIINVDDDNECVIIYDDDEHNNCVSCSYLIFVIVGPCEGPTMKWVCLVHPPPTHDT